MHVTGRIIVKCPKTGKWELIEGTCPQAHTVVRSFTSEGSARNWSETYGFPMEPTVKADHLQTEPEQVKQELQPAPTKDLSEFWYNKL